MKNIRVAFVRYNKIEPSTGIGNVCWRLEEQLSNYTDIDLIKIDPPLKVKNTTFIFKIINRLLFILWYTFVLPVYCKIKKIDVYIEMNMLFPVFRFAKFYFFIYDLAFAKFPTTVLKRNYNKRIDFLNKIDLSKDKIFAISESTKKDFIEFKKSHNTQNIVVATLASSLSVNENKAPQFIPNQYFLFVGTLEPRKNISNIVKAFYKFLKTTKSDFKLALVGKRGWMAEEIFDAIEVEPQLKDSIIILGYLSDKELSNIYKHAFALVYPSLYEGFGFPILEAMNHGAPVITAKNSSLPEVGGDAVIYSDIDAQSITDSMLNLYNNDELRNQIIKKGYEHAKTFSWKKFGDIIHSDLINKKQD